jgi:hypothetical protein
MGRFDCNGDWPISTNETCMERSKNSDTQVHKIRIKND